MKFRNHLHRKTGGSLIITQSDREYAQQHYRQFGAVLGVNHQGPIKIILEPNERISHLHRSVADEDTPTQEDIQAWINFGVGALNSGINLLIYCEAGQNRSVIVSSLIEAIFDKRNWWDIVNLYHEEMLQECPQSNWWPYDHWEKAISEWLIGMVTRPPILPIMPSFSAISMNEAIQLAGATRPDYLGSLYKYAKMIQKPGLIVEIGTCRAESTVVIACAIKGTGSRLVTIDPVFKTGEVWIFDSNIRGPGYVDSNVRDIINKLTLLGLAECVSICADYSWNVLSKWGGEQIDLLFIDGAHYPDDLRADLEWTKLIKPGKYLVIDDWFHDIKETSLAYLSDKPFRLLHESTNTPTEEYCVTIFQKT